MVGVTLALVLARAAQGDALVDDDAGRDFCRFADDDAHAVIDEHAPLDLGRGVDLDARHEFCKLGNHACKQFQVHLIQSVGKAVHGQGVNARIGEKDFKFIACGRIVAFWPLPDRREAF